MASFRAEVQDSDGKFAQVCSTRVPNAKFVERLCVSNGVLMRAEPVDSLKVEVYIEVVPTDRDDHKIKTARTK